MIVLRGVASTWAMAMRSRSGLWRKLWHRGEEGLQWVEFAVSGEPRHDRFVLGGSSR
jgi:hypothetical protein